VLQFCCNLQGGILKSDKGAGLRKVSSSKLSTMASQLVSVAGKKPSWVPSYFRVENRRVLDKSDGQEKEILSDVCTVILDTGLECGKVYKHLLRNGTKSLQRHLISQHNCLPAIREEIVKHGLSPTEVATINFYYLSSF
jgi:hypothetical protein